MNAAPSDAGEGLPHAAADGAAQVPAATPVPTLNLANLLTISRLVLVPLFVFALFQGSGADTTWRAVATGLFAIASATDQVDGWVARRYGLITDFGKIADPIADKALIGAALIGLSALGELPWWVTLVIAVREIGVTLLRFWVIRHGVIPASRGGKAKTMAQIVAIVAYLLPLPAGVDPVRWTLMGLALALTVITGVDYLIRAIRLRAAGRRATGAR
ncbi:CDP-diacylglycerol--glycerol-3-phosphate 3-phosphatidyltransferase [Amycolatopsis sulphurea]|uniref:CDP-diacylglycerol--glycerol-3-phosphate 3-phosphatidyltransferase n=1 Tax=Amycolatopsis sulphurea TaxID=76022 RepID=A0A2A9FIX2_9PSEU|nr:CDP-diacylglycerol--glycerol-3-phosphate 3-phosphatidyltransferase [Amycolatopsis sulphurea]PFG50522.1 CDP-diacylglycerol--glycerol-3-phosphate 3-phosphatidyltransferase [Amycolatopsis sulphurea]